MVKKLLILLLLSFTLFGGEITEEGYRALLNKKIQSLLDEKSYEQNRAFIKLLFSPASDFFYKDRVDSVKVIATLKENGLLNLFYNKPTEVELGFKTNGAPLFFVKIITDTLRNIGYYRFVTKSSSYNNSGFFWSVSIVSEYAADPMILQKEFSKAGCEIVDIVRESPTKWIYTIDMSHAFLNVVELQNGLNITLQRSLFPYWLDVSHIRKLRIESKRGNSWYPDISYYDALLHLVKVVQRDKRSYDITLKIPKDAKYIKIADIYTMKNIKDSLILHPIGSR